MTDARYVFLVEMTVDKPFSSSEVEQRLRDSTGQDGIVVWGVIDGVDAAFRKLRQLSRETENDASKGDRMHSAQKALSFFRDVWPASFWRWKRIGEDHPTDDERPMMAGR